MEGLGDAGARGKTTDGGQVASRFEGNWGPTEFKEGNLIKSANSSRQRVRWSLEVG